MKRGEGRGWLGVGIVLVQDFSPLVTRVTKSEVYICCFLEDKSSYICFVENIVSLMYVYSVIPELVLQNLLHNQTP